MYVGMPTLIATLTLQSATVTLSKEGTKAGAALGTLLTAAFWATPCTVVTPTFGVVRVFVEVNVASERRCYVWCSQYHRSSVEAVIVTFVYGIASVAVMRLKHSLQML